MNERYLYDEVHSIFQYQDDNHFPADTEYFICLNVRSTIPWNKYTYMEVCIAELETRCKSWMAWVAVAK